MGLSRWFGKKTIQKQLFDRFAERLPAKLKPYKVDIVQGNYVTNSMVSNLSKGQSRDQVRAILGTPLISTHSERIGGIIFFDKPWQW